jgi:hypothetical protein
MYAPCRWITGQRRAMISSTIQVIFPSIRDSSINFFLNNYEQRESIRSILTFIYMQVLLSFLSRTVHKSTVTLDAHARMHGGLEPASYDEVVGDHVHQPATQPSRMAWPTSLATSVRPHHRQADLLHVVRYKHSTSPRRHLQEGRQRWDDAAVRANELDLRHSRYLEGNAKGVPLTPFRKEW